MAYAPFYELFPDVAESETRSIIVPEGDGTEGFSLQEALGKTIRAYGVKEFASKAKMPSSNVLRSIDARHNPTQKTLEQLLRPLGLQLTVAPRRKPSAA